MLISTEDSKNELMLKVAKLYYYDNWSQQKIAEELHISRSNVSRLLSACLKEKIVEIRINDSMSVSSETANIIKRRYQLQEVYISESHTDVRQNADAVGALAAEYVKSVLSNGMLLGISSGYLCRSIAMQLKPPLPSDVDVVQLMGGICDLAHNCDGQSLTTLFAKRLVGKAHILHAPLMVKSNRTREAIVHEPVIRNTMELYNKIDLAIVNIEQMQQNNSNNQVLMQADLVQLQELNAKASIVGRYFDIDGNSCNAGINERVISIGIDQLRATPHVMAVVAGKDKLKATISILRCGLVNALFLDDVLANSLAYMK